MASKKFGEFFGRAGVWDGFEGALLGTGSFEQFLQFARLRVNVDLLGFEPEVVVFEAAGGPADGFCEGSDPGLG